MENSDTIHSRMLSNISSEYDKSEGSFFYDATKPAAIEQENIGKEIESVKKKLDIENLQGEELEAWIYQRTGIKRKVATKATGYVLITGAIGAQIKDNEVVSSDTVNFLFMENKIIDETGIIEVKVECELFGVIGNVPAGAIKFFPITLAGLMSVTNQMTFTNGYEAEKDSDLLQRYYERIKTPSTSGNKYHYKNWAKEITGVGDAKVFPLWAGDNTVKVVIIDSNKHPAGPELVEEVQNYIDPDITGLGDGEAPIGAYCTVVSANEVPLNISFTANKDPSIDDTERQTNVENNINAYIKEIAFKENTISYNAIGSRIYNSTGILDYSNLAINGQTGNIILQEDDIPVLGVVSIA